MSNELGLHIGKKNNVAADIAIFSKKQLSSLKNKYITTAPKVVIEIDAKADFTNISPADYFHIKMENLLNFGVEQVVWVFTNSKKVMVATAKKPWTTQSWNTEIQILNTPINIWKLIEEEDMEFEI